MRLFFHAGTLLKMNSFKNLFKDFSWTVRTSFSQNRSLLIIVGRGFLTSPMLWRPLSIAYTIFLKFCPTTLSCCLQPLLPLLFLMSCFFDWMGDRSTFDVMSLNDNMDLCRVLVPQYQDDLSVFHAHTHRDTQHTQGPIDWHTHMNIY